MRARLAALVASSFTVHAACAECEDLLDCPTGSICSAAGTCVDECPDGEYLVDLVVTAPDQVTLVPGELAIDASAPFDTGPSATVTGYVSSGTHTFRARRGDFTGDVTVDVCEGGRIAIPVRPPPGTIGVVQGAFDDIDRVLAGMGFVQGVDFDVIGDGEMTTTGRLDQYRYIFINCGHDLQITGEHVTNLSAWVEQGGALYASDLAFDVVERVFPGNATGGGGGSPGIYRAEVLDDELADHLGKTDVELDYNLGAWRHIDGVAAATNVLVRGTQGEVDGMPLLLQFTHGEGRVTYTTFHNEAQTTEDMDRILSYLVFSL